MMESDSRASAPVTVLVVLIVIVLVFLLPSPEAGPPDSGDATAGLLPLPDVEALRARFNQDRGVPRLILFLSPTSPECRTGGRWVQQRLLEAQPPADVRVYAIWLPVLPDDAAQRWDEALMPDPRVTHFWDDARTVSGWFARRVDFDGVGVLFGVVWDRYFLYGPEATWDETPTPILSTGYPVIAYEDELEEVLAPLLGR